MSKKVEWYSSFVDYNYKPKKTDLIALFYFESLSGMTAKEAVGRIASESSTGTWTTLFKMPKRMEKLKATAFSVEKNYVKIAYPLDLWEKGNMPQLLSGAAGNIFGMKALKNLRLIDISFPKEYLKGFKGPNQGISGLRKFFKQNKRPLTGAVPKPKVGFSAKEHSEIAFETWTGGFDLTKDDENLTSQSFNKFDERVRRMTKMRDKAEKITGEKKDALLNITGETDEMKRRAKLLHDNGWNYAMIDVVVAGTAAVQTLRNTLGDYGMAIHAYRAMHASLDRNLEHGVTMQYLAKMMRIVGVDQIHSGTAVGKLISPRIEVETIANLMREKRVKENLPHNLAQDFYNIKQGFPVASGGLHPGLVPDVMNILGNECVLLVSGGIHGHPKGTKSGAMAAMQAIEASMDGVSLYEKAKTSLQLKQALEKWGLMRPK